MMKLLGPMAMIVLLIVLIMLMHLRLTGAGWGMGSTLWQCYRLELYMYVVIAWMMVLAGLTIMGLGCLLRCMLLGVRTTVVSTLLTIYYACV